MNKGWTVGRIFWWMVLLFPIVLILAWTGQKLLQNYLLERLQTEILDEVRDQGIFERQFRFELPLRFTDYSVWGKYRPGTNEFSSLDKNELTDAIGGEYWYPTLPKRPHTLYLMTVNSKNGYPFKTWYRATLKICGDGPCPYEAQEFEEIPPPPDFMLPEAQLVETRGETRRIMWFRFNLKYAVQMNNRREISSVLVSISDWATNPVDRWLRGAWPNKPFERDMIEVRRIYASYPEGICEENHAGPVSLGDACF